MTLQLKLIIYGILALGLIIGEASKDYWIYHQGQLTGSANEVKVQAQALKDNQEEFNKLRAKELREARSNFDKQLQNERKKTKALEDANQILNKQNDTLRAAFDGIVPDEYIGVLNRDRGSFGSDEGSDGPSSGSDEKVPPTSGTPEGFTPLA